jgi:putative ABC transport system permease protein
MIRDSIEMALRSLLKHRIYTLISVVGLAFGIGTAMISMSYVIRELSWEDCHKYHDRIYRVEMQYRYADTLWSSARVMAPLGAAILNEIPGIEQIAVFRHHKDVSAKVDNNMYRAGNLIFAGPEFFDVFSFNLKSGYPASVLENPHSVLITDSIARVYFPRQDPVGKSIALKDQSGDLFELQVVGILEDMPPLTQLHCDFVASYSTLRSTGADVTSWTGEYRDLTYLLLDEATDPAFLAAQISSIASQYMPAEMIRRISFSIKPLKDIYFTTYYSGNRGEIWPGGEYDMTIIMVAAGLFILIMAIINFINLSTARAADRMKEVGVRKTFGASRIRLVAQFLGESLILTFAATAFGLLLYDIFRKGYRTMAPDKYELANVYGDPGSILLIVLLAGFVGILAGYYPSLYLSRFRPIAVLKDGTTGGPSRSLLRKSLTTFQFTLAILFITLTIGYYIQLRFLTQYDLGFIHENVLVLPFPGDATGATDCARAKNEILAHNDVLGAARTDGILGSRYGYVRCYSEPEREETDRKYSVHYIVDYDFLSFYGIDLLEGRNFSPNRPEDIGHAVLISESMKDRLGWDNPVGYHLYTDSAMYEIIGVVRDFHGTAFRTGYTSASIITLEPEACRILCVNLPSNNINESIAAIHATWQQVFGDRVFNYSFLDDNIRSEYWELDSITSFFGVLAIISIIISGMGIFGLILYTVERRTREMAIRKVLGASSPSILRILTREFVLLIGLANGIAFPFAYIMLSGYINQYPLRASLGFETYLGGGLLTILVAFAVSGYHVRKAARANPTDTLRYE